MRIAEESGDGEGSDWGVGRSAARNSRHRRHRLGSLFSSFFLLPSHSDVKFASSLISLISDSSLFDKENHRSFRSRSTKAVLRDPNAGKTEPPSVAADFYSLCAPWPRLLTIIYRKWNRRHDSILSVSAVPRYQFQRHAARPFLLSSFGNDTFCRREISCA